MVNPESALITLRAPRRRCGKCQSLSNITHRYNDVARWHANGIPRLGLGDAALQPESQDLVIGR